MDPPLQLSAGAVVLDEHGRILLIRENYDRRRYGFPGGALEPGETPTECVVRETREETGVDIVTGPLIGMYTLRNPGHTLVCFVFRCELERGEPEVPPTGEIAEIGWFDPHALPRPTTNVLPRAVEDLLAGRTGVAREIPRLN